VVTDAQVIAAIRANHLQANIGALEREPRGYRLHWSQATVDPGGTIFGPGPYVKLPVSYGRDRWVVRVYAPARLRRRLAKAWTPKGKK
jgi:hypothetical protein